MAAAVEAVVAKGRHERWCAEGQRGGEVSQAHVNNRSAAQRQKQRNFGRRTMSGRPHAAPQTIAWNPLVPVLFECIEPFSAEDRRDAAAPNTFPSRVMYETSMKASESSAAWSLGWSPACTDSASHMPVRTRRDVALTHFGFQYLIALSALHREQLAYK